MDDYKRGLLMRVRDRLMDPSKYHTGLCNCFADEFKDDGALVDHYELFIKGFTYEMDQLFDYTCFDFDGHIENIDRCDYWWYPPHWVEPRIAMIDFLLNNR